MNKNKKILCKDIFDEKLKLFNIIIVKNISQTKTFVFNKTIISEDTLNFMFEQVKNKIVEKTYELNNNAYCIQISNQKNTIKSRLKKLFK